MEIAESIGFIQFWGFTPCMNILSDVDDEIKILSSGSADLRHILYSISEECTLQKNFSLIFYLHENDKEVMARHMLLILLINDLSLPIRERVELFLDIYANALTRERTAEHIQSQAQLLIKIITQPKDAPQIKSIFDLSSLKFKERDELEEVFRSWNLLCPFDMGGLRDQRLRYHYKERYDYRDNLADWDFHWYFKDLAPQVNYRHYKEWRNTGVAYEYRLATYTAPNRTLSGYIPGKTVKNI